MKDMNNEKLTLEQRVENLEKLHFYGFLVLIGIGIVLINKYK